MVLRHPNGVLCALLLFSLCVQTSSSTNFVAFQLPTSLSGTTQTGFAGGVGCPLSPTLRLLGQRQGAEAEHQPMMNAERGVVSRRTASILGASVLAGFAQQAAAMDWVPEAPKEGDCADCIGVTNGFLANCPDTNTCVSSQDDQGPKADMFNAYAEPWVYEGTPAAALLQLKFQIQRFGGKIVREEGPYVRVEFRSQSLPGQVDHFDDAEFYFTPNDYTVQFRSARRPSKLTASPMGDFGANKKRLEDIRKALRWEKLTVLRNRKRAFLFFESPLDTFGPACNGVGCGEGGPDDSRDDVKKPTRFDTDPLAAPALPFPKAGGR